MNFKIYTEVDSLMNELKKGPSKLSRLSKKLKVSEALIEQWSKLLEEKGLIEVNYPFMGEPILKLKMKDELAKKINKKSKIKPFKKHRISTIVI